MLSRRSTVREYLQGALWVLPTLAVILGLLGGAGLAAIPIGSESALAPFLFQGTADDARQLLIVVSATMITVTGIVFSMTVVSLQIASSQFSVRLLRTFTRDVPNQIVLAIFICTFAYSTGGLYTVGARAAGGAFVPRVAVSGSLWLAFLSTGALVYFLHRLVHSIQIDTIMEGVQRRTLGLIEELFPNPDVIAGAASSVRTRDGAARALARAPDGERPDGAVLDLIARRPGYIQSVDTEAMAALARAHGVRFRLIVSVGDYLTVGTRLGWCTSRTAGRAPDPSIVMNGLRSVHVGFERTLQQDVRFGLRQLVDIALRALSPAINDPYTAIQVVHHLSAVETVLAARAIGDETAWDGEDLLVRLPNPGFTTYLEIGTAQIRRCGAHEPLLLTALLQMLSAVAAQCVDPERRAAVLEHVTLIEQAAELTIPQAGDRVLVTAGAELTRAVALDPGRAAPPPSAFGMVAAAASHHKNVAR